MLGHGLTQLESRTWDDAMTSVNGDACLRTCGAALMELYSANAQEGKRRYNSSRFRSQKGNLG